ncbi:MAG TPA: GerMN domain-containing protein, partial [Clostridia bacterium]|nr:GerMN domain-containing protein [Clostridia bacterium]
QLSRRFGNLNGQALQLQQTPYAVEVSDNMVTVNLGVTTRLLTNREQFLLRLAITNTLTELPEIQYADVLVNGRDEGVDLAATIPCGVLARYPSIGDIDTYWRQIEGQINQSGSTSKLSKTVALYFPSADGKHLLAEVRNVVFPGYQQEIFVDSILSELAKGSAQLNTRQIMPPLNYLPEYDPPRILSPSGSAYRLIALTFYDGLDDYLAVMGGSRGMLFASLTYTLTSFVPGIDGLMITIGDEQVTQVEDMDGRTLHFDSGWMTRADFSGCVASNCRIYLPSRNGETLVPVDRAVSQEVADEPRTLLSQLLMGPQSFDRGDETVAAFPEGITEADILSIAVQDDTVRINFTEKFAKACETLTENQGRNLIYSVVNTLTELRGVRRVRFYIEGEQRQFMNNDLSTAGEFLRHPGLIRS